MQAIDKARKEGKRAFYSEYTKTIRSCPENYCLAVKDYEKINRWIVFDDGACKKYYPKIQRVIDKHGAFATENVMADLIAKCIPKKHGYDSWQT